MSTETLNLSQVSLYNTQRVTDEQSKSLFSVRINLFELIIESIRNSRCDAPPQHHLIYGQRGMGKTTLLKRIEVEIRTSSLRDSFIPLLFPEEQYNLDSLTTFWLNCLDSLADVLEKEGRENDTNDIDHEVERLASLPSEERANKAYSYFRHIVFNLNRRPVLLVDNINYVLKRLSIDEQHTLRALMTENNAPIIIGASSIRIDETNDYNAPFYDAFQVHYLKRLKSQELILILNNLATITGQIDLKKDIRNNSSRLKALNQLTGGNPRTAVILFKQAIKGFSNDISEDLEGILDDLTPLYKSRFEELPEKMQIIINAIAMQWEPITLEQIRNSTQMDNGQISPQLTRLSDAGWIEKPKSARGKGGSYEVSERMFNIWFLMRRSSRRHKKMVACLSQFIEAFYEKGNELSEMLREIMLKQFTDVKHAVTALALAKLTDDKKARWDLHAKTHKFIIDHPEISDSFEFKDLYDGAEEHAEALIKAIQDDDAQATIYHASPLFEAGGNEIAPFLAQAYINNHQFPDAKRVIDSVSNEETKYRLLIDLIVTIHDIDPSLTSSIEAYCKEAIACGNFNSDAYFFYAKYLVEEGRFKEALAILKAADKVFPEDPRLYCVTGESYYYLGDNEKAEAYLTSPVIDKESEPGLINYYLGTIRYDQHKYPEAIKLLSKAQDGMSPHALLFNVWLIPALIMDGHISESRELFNKTMQMLNTPNELAKVLTHLLSKEQKYDILSEYLQKMIEKWPDASILRLYVSQSLFHQDAFTDALHYLEPYLHENPQDSSALFLRGMIAWQSDESYEVAKEYIQKSLSFQENYINYHALGLIEQAQAHYTEAAQYYEKVLSLEPREFYCMILLSEICEYKFNQIERARSLAEGAIKINAKEASYRLVNLYRDGLYDNTLAEDCIRGISKELRDPEWEAIHHILTAIHQNDFLLAKKHLYSFYDQFNTEGMGREKLCYLYAKCIECGFGQDLLSFLEEVGIKESASPEFYAVESLLSNNPSAFFDSVAKETREIGLSIAEDIKYFIKE